MSSTANLQIDTLGVPPPATKDAEDELREQRRKASLALARGAIDAAELLQWLDMLGLPPCERTLRTSHGERNRAGVYGEAR